MDLPICNELKKQKIKEPRLELFIFKEEKYGICSWKA